MQKIFTTAFILFILVCALQTKLAAQTNLSIASGTASIGVASPNASAILDVTSTSKGILVPRMTSVQKTAISSPAIGLLVFQTDGASGFYYYTGSAWQLLTSSAGFSGWGLTGNSGTSQTVNFLGTTDANALVFKVNNQRAGYIDYIATGSNAAFGYNALKSITSGGGNTANGFGALYSDTSGYSNIATGIGSLYKNTNGHNQVAVGDSTLFNSSNSAGNTAIGSKSLYSNAGGYSNVAAGIRSLYKNTTGNNQVAAGDSTLFNSTTGSGNTAIGSKSLFSNTSGYSNIATGISALYKNTSGHNQVAAGDSALFNSTVGIVNTAVGSKSLYSNTGGSYNVGVGISALYSNSIGQHLVALGDSALFSTTGTTNNTAIGSRALYSTTTGINNTGVGLKVLFANTTGSENTATGYNALLANKTGNFNTANGYLALVSASAGNTNTALGAYTLYSDTTGYSNVAAGIRSLYSNTTGNNLVAIGDSALFKTNGGGLNTAVGSKALYTNTTGTNNTALGAKADVISASLTNGTALGYQASVTASNQVRVGNSAVTSIGGYVNWSNISDGRFKKNIKEDVKGLAFIKKLKPVTYTLDITGINNFLHPGGPTQGQGTQTQALQNGGQTPDDEQTAIAVKEKIVYNGFIAQDVEKTAKELSYDFSGVDAPKSKADLYGLRYSDFVVPLVKAVQELSFQNDSIQATNQQLQKENKDLKNSVNNIQSQLANILQQLSDLKAAQEACCFNASQNNQPTGGTTGDAPRLEQNAPNPFNANTVIRYYLPATSVNGQIMVSNVSGQVLKYYTLSSKGAGQITVYSGELASGNYFYTLIVDGKKIATKQMVLLQ